MKILSLFFRQLYQNINPANAVIIKQIPQIPKEILTQIFYYTQLPGVAKLGLSCKEWNQLTAFYLKDVKKTVIKLCKDCEQTCLISSDQIFNTIDYTFEGILNNQQIRLNHSCYTTPDFYLNTRIRIINLFIEDSSLRKTWRTFICSGKCIGYACTILDNVQSVDLKYNLSSIQRKYMDVIQKALNLYLQYRSRLDDS